LVFFDLNIFFTIKIILFLNKIKIIEEYLELIIVSDDLLFELILKINDIMSFVLMNEILCFISLINNNFIFNKKIVINLVSFQMLYI
jgi:hypothetical protein